MSRSVRLALGGLAASVLTVPALVGGAGLPGASAAPGVPHLCNEGDVAYTVSTPAKSPTITHASSYDNYGGRPATYTKKASTVTVLAAQVEASYDLETGGSAKIFKIFSAEAKSHFHAMVAAQGMHTSRSAVKIAATMKSGDTYIFFDGWTKYTATWTESECNAMQTGYEYKDSGPVKSYALQGSGDVGCKTHPTAGSLAYLAKKRYC